MNLTIEPTGRIEFVNGQKCRVWTGKSDAGVVVECLVALVRTESDDKAGCAALEQSLQRVEVETQPVIFDNRFVI